jgi:hypothetical protein
MTHAKHNIFVVIKTLNNNNIAAFLVYKIHRNIACVVSIINTHTILLVSEFAQYVHFALYDKGIL